MMGVWFLGASIGNFLGGQAASFYESMPLESAAWRRGDCADGAGFLMLLFRKPLTRLIGD